MILARSRIIDTALRLFYDQGYLATGINQIITESRVAKATFYHHFSSKENLCVAYLQARHIIWMEWLRTSVENHESVESRILGIFGFLREWMVSCDFRGCAFLNIASEIPNLNSQIRTEVVRHKDDLRLYVKQMISLLRNSHEPYQLNDREIDANMVYVLIEGAIVASQNYGDLWPIEAAQIAVRSLLNI
ncbi:MAG: TetR/AcrR family transcriptional regulator [Candidatus Scalindua sp. AMX11]|nr:MAG: TetR/AcrR family transcriptional regulator [Candidatus Scalindua sp.]NOG85083.1 TetR/AcrR family transcriptional regulator [Planctomycetota bacterium]RZV93130.1 MAG: TetR/AcrR family transcriptional regulator [Candidatus Scalindua sp. SCAELEC01]TDE66755.1 MAG: TetR/AcrR family transcriptional regulator [Candidatus Scalindua sp. AMX11]GJQ58068.1 MAG: TetR family transcriptional regulator [Candidatus Scalindua sp.]